jgi:predicted nucleic-acid-binding protein
MIGLDTNILARYFTCDDDVQTPLAVQLFEEKLTPQEPGFISTIVIVELIWLLERLYKVPAPEIENILRELLAAPNLVIECNDELEAALVISHGGIADRLIHLVGKSASCAMTLTFDRSFAQIEGVELLA